MDERGKIRLRWRGLLVLAAWVVSAAATVFPYAPLLKTPWLFFLFPYGLMTFLVWLMGWRAQQAPHFLLGWVLYFVLTAAALLTGRRLWYLLSTVCCARCCCSMRSAAI